MALVNLFLDNVGAVGVYPQTWKLESTDDFDAITTAGYLNQDGFASQNMHPGDIVEASYNSGANTLLMVASIGNGMITLSATEADVVLPVVAGNFGNWIGTTGAFGDLGYSPTNAAKTKVVMANAATVANHIMVSTDTAGTSGNLAGTAINNGSLQAGASGTAGSLISYPSASSKGYLETKATANTGDTATIITNVAMGQATTLSYPDPGLASAFFNTGLSSSSAIAPKTFVRTITASAAALATSGHVAVQASTSGTCQFVVTDITVTYTASGLSGGGGDRLLSLTDGTIVFNQAGITAALLGTPVYTLWGGSGNPLPGSVSTTSTAGAAIYLVYAGGTTDYTLGSVVIQVTLAQVTQ